MKFSVIIPAYKAEKYIAKAIESCLNQTYMPHEILVVDDGSPDRGAEIAASYPPPVRVIRLAKNMGLPSARNRGVQESTGEWLVFLDADDWFLPGKLEAQRLCALENKQAILIYTGFLRSRGGVESPAEFNPPAVLWPMLRYCCPFHVGTVALRRDVFDAIGGFDPSLRLGEEWDLWIRLAVRYSTASFAAVPEALAVYRVTPGSLTSNSMLYFQKRYALVERRCLTGTSGLSRFFWRKRIYAFLYYDTSIPLREEGSNLDLSFILKSLVLWPFPSRVMPLKRYKVAAVMVKQHAAKWLRGAKAAA